MIEILSYEKANKNRTIGYVDIKLPNWNNLIIRRIAHVQGDSGRRWFNLPTFSKEKQDGSLEYYRYFEFETKVHNAQLLEEISDLVKAYCEKHKISDTPPVDFSARPTGFSEETPF